MNILDLEKINICFERIICILKKSIISLNTCILVLVCPCQKWTPENVSNASQIIQESFSGAFSVHFRGP